MVGGNGVGDAVLGDAWALDPAAAAWTSVVIPVGLPTGAIAAHASTGDGLVVVSAGSDGTGRTDLVRFDVTTLAQTGFATPPDGPPPRLGASLINDPSSERLLLFGGAGTIATVGDLWSLDLP